MSRNLVVAAFVGPEDSKWQGSAYNVMGDGSWWRWNGGEWVCDYPAMPQCKVIDFAATALPAQGEESR